MNINGDDWLYININDADCENISKANDCDRGLAAYIFTTDYAQVIFGIFPNNHMMHEELKKKRKKKEKKI